MSLSVQNESVNSNVAHVTDTNQTTAEQPTKELNAYRGVNLNEVSQLMTSLAQSQGRVPPQISDKQQTLSRYLDSINKKEFKENPKTETGSEGQKLNRFISRFVGNFKNVNEEIGNALKQSAVSNQSGDKLAAEISRNIANMPKILQEGSSAGKALLEFVAQAAIAKVEPQKLTGFWQQQVANSNLSIVSSATPREQQEISRVLSDAVKFIYANQSKALQENSGDSLLKSLTQMTSSSSSVTTEATNTKNSTYLNIFQQLASNTSATKGTQSTSEISADMLEKINLIITKAARIAIESKLIEPPIEKINETIETEDFSLQDLKFVKDLIDKASAAPAKPQVFTKAQLQSISSDNLAGKTVQDPVKKLSADELNAEIEKQLEVLKTSSDITKIQEVLKKINDLKQQQISGPKAEVSKSQDHVESKTNNDPKGTTVSTTANNANTGTVTKQDSFTKDLMASLNLTQGIKEEPQKSEGTNKSPSKELNSDIYRELLHKAQTQPQHKAENTKSIALEQPQVIATNSKPLSNSPIEKENATNVVQDKSNTNVVQTTKDAPSQLKTETTPSQIKPDVTSQQIKSENILQKVKPEASQQVASKETFAQTIPQAKNEATLNQPAVQKENVLQPQVKDNVNAQVKAAPSQQATPKDTIAQNIPQPKNEATLNQPAVQKENVQQPQVKDNVNAQVKTETSQQPTPKETFTQSIPQVKPEISKQSAPKESISQSAPQVKAETSLRETSIQKENIQQALPKNDVAIQTKTDNASQLKAELSQKTPLRDSISQNPQQIQRDVQGSSYSQTKNDALSNSYLNSQGTNSKAPISNQSSTTNTVTTLNERTNTELQSKINNQNNAVTEKNNSWQNTNNTQNISSGNILGSTNTRTLNNNIPNIQPQVGTNNTPIMEDNSFVGKTVEEALREEEENIKNSTSSQQTTTSKTSADSTSVTSARNIVAAWQNSIVKGKTNNTSTEATNNNISNKVNTENNQVSQTATTTPESREKTSTSAPTDFRDLLKSVQDRNNVASTTLDSIRTKVQGSQEGNIPLSSQPLVRSSDAEPATKSQLQTQTQTPSTSTTNRTDLKIDNQRVDGESSNQDVVNEKVSIFKKISGFFSQSTNHENKPTTTTSSNTTNSTSSSTLNQAKPTNITDTQNQIPAVPKGVNQFRNLQAAAVAENTSLATVIDAVATDLNKIMEDINNPTLPHNFQPIAKSIGAIFSQSLASTPAIMQWLNYVESPLSGNNIFSKGLKAWATLLVTLRLKQFGLDVADGKESKATLQTWQNNTNIDDSEQWPQRFLQNIANHTEQLHSNQENRNDPTWASYIPLPTPQENIKENGMGFKRRKRENQTDAIDMNFYFEIKGLGAIGIKASYASPDISIKATAETYEGYSKLRETLHLLEERLSELNYNCKDFKCTKGTVLHPLATENSSSSSNYVDSISGNDGLNLRI